MILPPNCPTGGCGAKMPPDLLARALVSIPLPPCPNLLVGFGSADDAAVYRLTDRLALVSTVDFFPPMLDDPRAFGRIAAANALSDIYAMGADPVLALNLLCFPESGAFSDLEAILQGGAEAAAEAGVPIAGGHSIHDSVPKYGLCVTGIVDPACVLRNDTPRPGDALILTKSLGTGIVLAAHRAELADPDAYDLALAVMQRLNRDAAHAMRGFDVSACTDVTGFGLLGHAREMAGEKMALVIDPDSLPIQHMAVPYAREYLTTAAGQRNRNHLCGDVDVDRLSPALQEVLFDPQTSGGLLIAVRRDQAAALLARIRASDPCAEAIGYVKTRSSLPIEFGRYSQ